MFEPFSVSFFTCKFLVLDPVINNFFNIIGTIIFWKETTSELLSDTCVIKIIIEVLTCNN